MISYRQEKNIIGLKYNDERFMKKKNNVQNGLINYLLFKKKVFKLLDEIN